MNKILLFILLTISFFCVDAQSKNPCPGREERKYLGLLPDFKNTLTTGWVKIDAFSDEFDEMVLDETKWRIKDHDCHPMSPKAYFDRNNVRMNNGNVELFIRKERRKVTCSNWVDTMEYLYSSGYIVSQKPIRYGYMEMRCYVPSNRAFTPCFWLIGSTEKRYDEIDVFERTRPKETNMLEQNFHHNLSRPMRGSMVRKIYFEESYLGRWMVFAVEWLPEEVHFYVNGTLTSSIKYSDNQKLNSKYSEFVCIEFNNSLPQAVQISLSLQKEVSRYRDLSESFAVDYFRSYKLQEGFDRQYWPDRFDLDNPFLFCVHQSIKLGGEDHSAILPENQNITIWAKEEIILDKGFTLPANTEFAARTIKTDNGVFNKP